MATNREQIHCISVPGAASLRSVLDISLLPHYIFSSLVSSRGASPKEEYHSELPGLMKSVSAHGRGIGTLKSLSNHSVIL